MSDTPIAERLAADLGMPWPLRPPRHDFEGQIFDYFEPGDPGSEGRLGGPDGCGPVAEAGPYPPTNTLPGGNPR